MTLLRNNCQFCFIFILYFYKVQYSPTRATRIYSKTRESMKSIYARNYNYGLRIFLLLDLHLNMDVVANSFIYECLIYFQGHSNFYSLFKKSPV
jgi:hypothetical protein